MIQINYREPNVDRFIEIMATAKKFNYEPKFHILNMPRLYVKFLNKFELKNEEDITKADFAVEHTEIVDFNTLFKKPESINDITSRIVNCKPTNTESLCVSSLAILKNASEKLNFTKDDIQDCINLAHIISFMDESNIKVEHIAESIQYKSIIKINTNGKYE